MLRSLKLRELAFVYRRVKALLGEQLIVEDELIISDVYIDADAANLTYQFTDIYNQKYWTDPVQ